MRLGLIARATNRGLGLQTQALYRHLDPDITLVVTLPTDPYEPHYERFEESPGDTGKVLYATAEQVPSMVPTLLDSCDVLLSCETFYDDTIPDQARAAGVKTFLQGNYELLYWLSNPDLPRPDTFIAPSTWELSRWPKPVVFLPLPVDRQAFPFTLRTQAKTFLHIVGHPAMGDRAGTQLVLEALRYVTRPIEVVIRSQQPLQKDRRIIDRIPHWVKVRVIVDDVIDNLDLYDGADVLLAPRRYGGLSLPLDEAQSLGMPVIALDREPERSLLPPESLVPSYPWTQLRCASGRVESTNCDVRELAKVIDRLAGDPSLVETLSQRADLTVQGRSWDVLRERYFEVLGTRR